MVIVTETIMDEIADKLGIDRLDVRKANLMKTGDIMHYGDQV